MCGFSAGKPKPKPVSEERPEPPAEEPAAAPDRPDTEGAAESREGADAAVSGRGAGETGGERSVQRSYYLSQLEVSIFLEIPWIGIVDCFNGICATSLHSAWIIQAWCRDVTNRG